MKKQALSTILVLALMVSTYLLGTPVKVNAGRATITGGSEDSSTPAGDSFRPDSSQTLPEAAPGVNVEIGSDGSLSTPLEVQNSLNAAIANIISQTPEPNSPSANIIAIVQQGASASQAINQLQQILKDLGVRESLVRSLVTALVGLSGNRSASVSGVNGDVKGLVANSAIAQQQVSPTLDINQLNAAITAYNTIVMQSSPEALRQLAKDPQFREIGKLLKQLRAALSTQ